jgi:uncharacterized membrane protein
MSDPTVPSSPSPEPAPGSAVTPPPIIPAAGGADTTTAAGGLTPNVAAGLACAFGLISGIVFLVLEKKNPFVRFWAMQATIFGGAVFAFYILLMILLKIPFLGVVIGLLSLLVYLGIFVVWLLMVIKAFTGKEWEMPFIGKIAREQLAKMPAA